MAERIVLAVVSLAAAACFVVALGAARAEDDLFALQFRPARLGPAELRRAVELERTAGRLTPGERRVLLLAQLRLRAGDAPGAVALLRGAVRREPENAEAWLGLSRAAREADPALARTALQRLRELVPPVPAP
jgi:cytochrome c-type biogenesis protein CcmH/NrfG